MDSFAEFDVPEAPDFGQDGSLSEDSDTNLQWFKDVVKKKHNRKKRRQSALQRRTTLHRMPKGAQAVRLPAPDEEPKVAVLPKPRVPTEPAPKRAKIVAPVRRPDPKPFKFTAPRTTGTTTTTAKPFSFLAREEEKKKRQLETKKQGDQNDSEITFGGAFRPPQVKARRTISAKRLAELAKPKKRFDGEVKKPLMAKPKELKEVQKVFREPRPIARSKKATTIPMQVKSNLLERAEKRRQFNAKLIEEEKENRAAAEEDKKRAETEEKEELRNFRRELGHKPAPIRKYKPIERVQSKQTTLATTPNLRTAKRKRETANF